MPRRHGSRVFKGKNQKGRDKFVRRITSNLVPGIRVERQNSSDTAFKLIRRMRRKSREEIMPAEQGGKGPEGKTWRSASGRVTSKKIEELFRKTGKR